MCWAKIIAKKRNTVPAINAYGAQNIFLNVIEFYFNFNSTIRKNIKANKEFEIDKSKIKGKAKQEKKRWCLFCCWIFVLYFQLGFYFILSFLHVPMFGAGETEYFFPKKFVHTYASHHHYLFRNKRIRKKSPNIISENGIRPKICNENWCEYFVRIFYFVCCFAQVK